VERLTHGAAQFRLLLQLAAEGDPVDDPAAAWPEERETIIAGTLKVTAVEPVDQSSAPVVFDPTRAVG
jgi:catalase